MMDFNVKTVIMKDEFAVDEFINKVKWCTECCAKSGEIEIIYLTDFEKILVDTVCPSTLLFEGVSQYTDKRCSVCLSDLNDIRIYLHVHSYTRTVEQFCFEICNDDNSLFIISLEGEVR
ncbi:hypothetical protein AN641_03640 [Candidatus Epulonipiscioides gigas]|uniref:Uncharacterized protein n=1 Tax=Candidatus Epulonipiscium fishelsonii TaxID=77094 RepID=A0ACC8XFT9_9FIRM|nr:hypothetical protein AN396_02250 [Epulopiscium sp. SCG-B11WGA-EpuloA1]ONI45683.1 hypothetical protein AN641_03640 [Epulopiscium sp. SCG-C07WGA-EpuloA2]ONI48321.1 hypothetical protein AN643_02075 [Epulopiscium sp. SCG-B10WGA-EpuloB]